MKQEMEDSDFILSQSKILVFFAFGELIGTIPGLHPLRGFALGAGRGFARGRPQSQN
jgi:hypothetical protein